MTEIYANNATLATYSAYNDEHLSQLVKSTLSNSTNSDEFYKKLVELKNEQKKTLQFMEELYNHKQIIKEEILKSETNLKDLKSTSYPLERDDNYKFNINTISAYEQRPYKQIEQEIKNLSKQEAFFTKVESKPPIPQKTSTVTFQNTVSVARPNQYDTKVYESISDDLKKIEKIWDEFKFEDKNENKKSFDFNQKFEKRITKSNRQLTSSKRPSSVQVEWAPRVTIPEPFSMTIREQIKSDKKKKLSREMQDERDKRIEAELRECNKKFRAAPVPAHVMVPLYEKLKQEEEMRKFKLKKMSQEYMDKVSKPFNLTDYKKKESVARERRHSFSEGQSESFEFNAQPLPEFYFNDEELVEK